MAAVVLPTSPTENRNRVSLKPTERVIIKPCNINVNNMYSESKNGSLLAWSLLPTQEGGLAASQLPSGRHLSLEGPTRRNLPPPRQ